MAWDLKDEDLLARIAAVTAPPSDLLHMLSDDLWANAFSMWATDLGYLQGDYKASTLHHLWTDLSYGASGETIYARYVDPSGGAGLQWTTSVPDRFARVANGMASDYSEAVAETRQATIEMLEPYASRFRDDIHTLQSEHVSEPEPVPVRQAKPDASTVDRVNQMVLKELPEWKGGPGLAQSQAKFYATTEVVLIGDSHPASYYEYMDTVGHIVGTVTMLRRGGAFSAGRVELALNDLIHPGGQSHGDQLFQHPDEPLQAVVEAIGRVSNKEVRIRS